MTKGAFSSISRGLTNAEADKESIDLCGLRPHSYLTSLQLSSGVRQPRGGFCTYTSGWKDAGGGRFSPSGLARQGELVLQKLSAWGLSIPPSNRIEQAIVLTDAVNAETLSLEEEETRIRTREAFRTLWEALIIVYTADQRPRRNKPFPLERLRCLLEGASTASEDANPRARSTQFELYLTALLVLGGADVRAGEPDLQFLYHGKYVGLAAKRVHSINEITLRNRLRGAKRQIEQSTGKGFIAVNLDAWVSELDVGGDVAELGASFTQQVQAAHDHLYALSGDSALLGYLLFGEWFDWRLLPSPRLEFHSPRQISCFTVNEAEVAKVREFFDPFLDRQNNGLREILQLVSKPAS